MTCQVCLFLADFKWKVICEIMNFFSWILVIFIDLANSSLVQPNYWSNSYYAETGTIKCFTVPWNSTKIENAWPAFLARLSFHFRLQISMYCTKICFDNISSGGKLSFYRQNVMFQYIMAINTFILRVFNWLDISWKLSS
jgi:hypothetical protein